MTDEAIKYVLGYYGEPAAPIDPNVMDRVMSLPRAKQFENWKPEAYEKSVEELRREFGPELSDDDLLLKILIPGKPVKRAKAKKKATPAVTRTAGPVTPSAEFLTEFTVDVDGEVFNVKIRPAGNEAGETEGIMESETLERPKELPPGAVPCGMAGLVLSIEVKVGAHVNEGDLVAIIEAMKMRRHVNSPLKGVVKDILAREGEMVAPEDILMVVE
jgi:pyruvate carboxylase subunit B